MKIAYHNCKVVILVENANNLNWQNIYYGFSISPNRQLVVHTADAETDGLKELYAVPILGGLSTKYNGEVINKDHYDVLYRISSDSRAVAYWDGSLQEGKHELYSVFDALVAYLPMVTRQSSLSLLDDSRFVPRSI